MSSTTEPEYLENMGRPNWNGPQTQDPFLYPEPTEDIIVDLVVIQAQNTALSRETPFLTSRDQHWMIQWTLAMKNELLIIRRREIRHERNMNAKDGRLNQLTNWGPLRIVVEGMTTVTRGRKFHMKMMDRQHRIALAKIAEETRVRKPGPEGWNCQDWCKTVIQTAVEQGIFTQAEVDATVVYAEAIEPDN